MKQLLILSLALSTLVVRGAVTGQLWYGTGLGNPIVAGHFNSDGSNLVTVHTNANIPLIDVAVDTAAGFYWVVDSTTGTGTGDTNACSIIEYRLSNNSQVAVLQIGDPTTFDLVQDLVVDPTNHILYVEEWGIDQAHSGIMKVTYNPTTGAMTGGFNNPSFLVNNANYGGLDDVRYMSIDLPNHLIYFTDNDNGFDYAPFRPNCGVYIVSLTTPNPIPTRLTSTNNVIGGFPPGDVPGGSVGTPATDCPNGFIGALAVDSADNLVYFLVHSYSPTINIAQNALWYVSTIGGANQIATKVALPAGTALVYPGENGGLSFDPVSRQLYISDQDQTASGKGRILVGQLSVDGHGITSFTTNNMVKLTGTAFPEAFDAPMGTTFLVLPTITVSGTATHAVEQSTPVALASSLSTADVDGGYFVSATVQVTGGAFAGDGDVLAAATAGTSISASYDSATETLTLTNYDTIAHYQQVLASVTLQANSDNPDNYGANKTRTLTWTVSDGQPNIPAGSRNSATSSLTIDAVNDAPVNHMPIAQTTTNGISHAISGLSISDVDANPASDGMTVTLTVTNGTFTVRTDVANGLTSGGVANNGTATVTLNGTQNSINTTLAAANGLLYLASTTFTNDSLKVSTSDNGHNGTGGSLQDQDLVAITIDQPPAFTSTNNAAFRAGANGSFTVTASGFPAPAFDISGALPGGVTFNTTSGVLAGTPAAGSGGAYPVTFTAHNGIGSDATQNFTLTVNVPATVTCPSDVVTNVVQGACFLPSISFAATAGGFPSPAITYRIGANFITSPHVFPPGANHVSVTATNSTGTNSCSFDVTVLLSAAPRLSIVEQGTKVVVSWPTNFSCYTLQFAPVVSTNSWSIYPGPFTTNGGYVFVTNNAIGRSFFRLAD